MRKTFKKKSSNLHYSPIKGRCYIIYSPDTQVSSNGKFIPILNTQTQEKFGFTLVCNDLLKSIQKSGASLPAIASLENVIDRYTVETNAMNVLFVHSFPKIGLGVSTYSDLPKGHQVAEYVGERKHGTIKDSSYVFLLDNGDKIDTKNIGNIARFFNHCPQEHSDPKVFTANLQAVPMQASEQEPQKVIFVTIRDIKAFEPLCYDYGTKYEFDNGEQVELLDTDTYLPLDPHHIEL